MARCPLCGVFMKKVSSSNSAQIDEYYECSLCGYDLPLDAGDI